MRALFSRHRYPRLVPLMTLIMCGCAGRSTVQTEQSGSSHSDNEMVYRIFWVTQKFWTDIEDAYPEKKSIHYGEPNNDLKQYLSTLGITFPSGSLIFPYGRHAELVYYNTKANQRLFEKLWK